MAQPSYRGKTKTTTHAWACKARFIHSFPHLLDVDSQRVGQFEQGSDAAATTPLFWDESGVKLGNHRNTLSSAHV